MEELDKCQQLGVQLLSNQFCPHLWLHPWGRTHFDLLLWYIKVFPKSVWSLLNCHNSIKDQSIWKILMATNSNISLVSSLPFSILSSFCQTEAKRKQCCSKFNKHKLTTQQEWWKTYLLIFTNFKLCSSSSFRRCRNSKLNQSFVQMVLCTT